MDRFLIFGSVPVLPLPESYIYITARYLSHNHQSYLYTHHYFTIYWPHNRTSHVRLRTHRVTPR